MKYYTECDLSNFEAWSGGADTLKVLNEKGDADNVGIMLEEIYGEEIPSATQINDTLWFDRDAIAEWLGFSDWEEYENSSSDEDE